MVTLPSAGQRGVTLAGRTRQSRVPSGRVVAGGMLREGTPLVYYPEYRLYVKREDLACVPPGPPFSKARGVYEWVKKQDADLIGVLDTRHSQGGWAVARACQVLGKHCVVYYPNFKHEPGPREPQDRAAALGADLVPLPAGRSAILYHAAKKAVAARGGVMIPNALKLAESVAETAREVPNDACRFSHVLIPVSSGTIAAGVVRGFADKALPFLEEDRVTFVLHLGYSRSHDEVCRYVRQMSGVTDCALDVIDEGYAYKDGARPGPTPPWPCNQWYDLKTFRWWVGDGAGHCAGGDVLFWNIG